MDTRRGKSSSVAAGSDANGGCSARKSRTSRNSLTTKPSHYQPLDAWRALPSPTIPPAPQAREATGVALHGRSHHPCQAAHAHKGALPGLRPAGSPASLPVLYR